MGNCYIPNLGSHRVGSKAGGTFGPRHSWPRSDPGRHSSTTGILCNHALVENAMAKLTYVLQAPLCRHSICHHHSFLFDSFTWPLCQPLLRDLQGFKCILRGLAEV